MLPIEIIATGNVMPPGGITNDLNSNNDLAISIQTRGAISKGLPFNPQTSSTRSTSIRSAVYTAALTLTSAAWRFLRR
jgi:hypothetical protein